MLQVSAAPFKLYNKDTIPGKLILRSIFNLNVDYNNESKFKPKHHELELYDKSSNSYLKFDISKAIGCKITKAVLFLTVEWVGDNHGSTVQRPEQYNQDYGNIVVFLTKNNWSDQFVSWNMQPEPLSKLNVMYRWDSNSSIDFIIIF